MKLSTQRNGSRDGRLLVVSRDLKLACGAEHICSTLQAALDEWTDTEPELDALYKKLNHGDIAEAFAFDPAMAMAPLPRAYQWVDGSVYGHHGNLMKSAFDTKNDVEFPTDEPLMYQGGSDDMLGATDDIVALDEAAGIDFEAEITVITDDILMQSSAAEAGQRIRLVMLANDISLRNKIMKELSKRFGFYQSKPATAFSPVAVTPDELGSAWHDFNVHLPVHITWNKKEFGRPNAGVGASFNFGELLCHAAKTRNLCAGTILGSGTISNDEPGVGSACIAERRALERIATGTPKTQFMKFGDQVRIEMFDQAGQTVFGAINQKVTPFAALAQQRTVRPGAKRLL